MIRGIPVGAPLFLMFELGLPICTNSDVKMEILDT